MRYLILITSLFFLSCKEEETKQIILEEVEIKKTTNDSVMIFKNGEKWDTIPNPKVTVKFVSTEDSLIHY